MAQGGLVLGSWEHALYFEAAGALTEQWCIMRPLRPVVDRRHRERQNQVDDRFAPGPALMSASAVTCRDLSWLKGTGRIDRHPHETPDQGSRSPTYPHSAIDLNDHKPAGSATTSSRIRPTHACATNKLSGISHPEEVDVRETPIDEVERAGTR